MCNCKGCGNVVVPKGDKGDPGLDGVKGDTGDTGPEGTCPFSEAIVESVASQNLGVTLATPVNITALGATYVTGTYFMNVEGDVVSDSVRLKGSYGIYLDDVLLPNTARQFGSEPGAVDTSGIYFKLAVNAKVIVTNPTSTIRLKVIIDSIGGGANLMFEGGSVDIRKTA